MRFIVTGGAGFIGSNLVESLLEDGHKVEVVDNLSTGSLDNIPDKATKWLCPVSSIGAVGEGIDGIFHLGIPSSPYLYREDRHYCAQAIDNWIFLLEYAKGLGVKKIVFATTSSLYNGCVKPFYEDRLPLIKDFYTETRFHMERLGKVYYDLYNVENIGLRLFAVFGEHEEAKKGFANVVTQMMWAKWAGKPFDIWGKGTQTRDLIYVKDVVRAFRIAMESSIPHGIYNVGNGVEWTLNRMAKTIGCEVNYIPNPMQNYVERTKSWNGLAESELGFTPTYQVKEQIVRLSNV